MVKLLKPSSHFCDKHNTSEINISTRKKEPVSALLFLVLVLISHVLCLSHNQACSVKMAGYWPRCYLRLYASQHQKNNFVQYPAILTSHLVHYPYIRADFRTSWSVDCVSLNVISYSCCTTSYFSNASPVPLPLPGYPPALRFLVSVSPSVGKKKNNKIGKGVWSYETRYLGINSWRLKTTIRGLTLQSQHGGNGGRKNRLRPSL